MAAKKKQSKSGSKPKKARTAKQKKADRARSRAMKAGTMPKPGKKRASGKKAAKKAKAKKSHPKKKKAKAKSSSKPRKKPRKKTSGKRKGASRRAGKPSAATARAQVNVRVAREGGGGGGAAESRRKKKKGHRSGKRRSMRENPLDGLEYLSAVFTTALGALAAQVNDRFWATHALGPSTLNPGDGHFGDSPPTDGSYPGLYNATAILAPMDWKRWLSGVALAAIPYGASAFVPTRHRFWRTSMQTFAIGAGAVVVAKGATDLASRFLTKYGWAQRLFDGEMRASMLKQGSAYTGPPLPTAGLGAPQLKSTGCGACVNCATGVGACCGSKTAPPVQQPPTQTTTPPSSEATPPAMQSTPFSGAGAPPANNDTNGSSRPGRYSWGDAA